MRWVERRGFTLRAPSRGPERFVRLSLMERIGIVRGFFNVREARAEPEPGGDHVRVLAGGRPLSWRWLGEQDAQTLLDERLGTLEAMGYTLIDSLMATRGRWDWLYELVHRRLPERGPVDPEPRPNAALQDALSRLGLSPDAVVEGVATVLGLAPADLAEPDPLTVRKTDPEEIAVLLPFLVHHDRAEIRGIGERWVRTPTVAYQVPAPVLVRWLESDARISNIIAPRLRTEGLAMLGPDRLMRLSRTGQPSVRDAARSWTHRLSGA